jgi:small subunit ribosomal protein S25e
VGGTQKKPISTMEKRAKEEEEKAPKKEKKQKGGKAAVSTLTPEQVSLKRALEEVQKQKATTPYELSTKLGINISSAKSLLKQLEKQGSIKVVAKNRRTVLYVAA